MVFSDQINKTHTAIANTDIDTTLFQQQRLQPQVVQGKAVVATENAQ